MINVHAKKFYTVVMDGTREDHVDFVKEIMDDLNNKEFGKSTCRPLDDKHPSKIVIETRTTKDMYDSMMQVIERTLPGRCIFNPPM